MAGLDKLIKNPHAGEWLAWPVWLVTGFIGAVIIGGAITSLCTVIGYGDFFNSTLGSIVLSALIYVVLITLLVSIGRIPYRIKLPKGLNIVLVLMIAGMLIVALHSTNLANFFVLAVLAVVTGFVVVLSGVPTLRRKVTKKVLGIARAMSWSDIGLGMAGYLIYFVIFVAITILLTKLVPAYNPEQAQDLGFNALYGIERSVGFIVLVVIAPIAEELAMRGFLFGKLREAKMPFWPAAIIVSIMFGLAHGQWNVAIDTAILSMVACYLREATGTIWPGVIIHALKNGVAYVMLFVFVVR